MIDAQDLVNGIHAVWDARLKNRGDPRDWPVSSQSFSYAPGVPMPAPGDTSEVFDPVPFKVLQYDYIVHRTTELQVECVECHNVRLWERVTAL